jgi:hypothetical protein
MHEEISVLLILFNRPDKTQILFDVIRKEKPSKLYISADGPREGNESDQINCYKTREVVKKIDWKCEVRYRFLDINVGCAQGCFTGISWAFENEESLIVLEDDCIPDQSFFRFCREILGKYKDDERIMLISGTNVNTHWKRGDNSYHFSKLGGIHGWATWKRAWDKMDIKLNYWNDPVIKNLVRGYLGRRLFFSYEKVYDQLYKNRNNPTTWDYQFGFARIINSGLAVVPSSNLITNIGYGLDSTHTNNENFKTSKLNSFSIQFPLEHPEIIINDAEYDRIFGRILYPWTFKSVLSSWFRKLISNIKKTE